ncbi:MAG TPA: bifunctional diaminohydroxyphosphoribosylaminopyrimidine deaminase/5-amino-6-(5-phosphoribosylamino)uracil reductase RibD, partial [Candidatus Kapabacteria bacterium]
GEGAHLVYGGPHAEPNAIADAEAKGNSVRGATAYVTLEPHAHEGKTPPCTRLLIEKGIARCVIAMEDPNPKVSGRGIRELQAAGIAVDAGLLEEEARELNRFFIRHITTGLPYVTLKLASSLDGRSALANGEARWITSEASRRIVHQMRAEYDAVLVGARTVLADDPELTPRLVEGRVPYRILLDARMELPHSLKLFTDAHREKTIAITTASALARRGSIPDIQTIVVGEDRGRIDLANAWKLIGERGIASVLVEAGPRLAASILRSGLFEEIALFLAPTLFGSDALPSVGPLDIAELHSRPELRLQEMMPVPNSSDIFLRFRHKDGK